MTELCPEMTIKFKVFEILFLHFPNGSNVPCGGGNLKFPIDSYTNIFLYTTTFINRSLLCILCQFLFYVLCQRKKNKSNDLINQHISRKTWRSLTCSVLSRVCVFNFEIIGNHVMNR